VLAQPCGGAWIDAQAHATFPERSVVRELTAALGLPLVHHLVRQCLGYTPPPVTPEMPAGDADLPRRAGAIVPEFPEPPPHARREHQGDRTERAGKVPGVELAMQLAEPRQRAPVRRG